MALITTAIITTIASMVSAGILTAGVAYPIIDSEIGTKKRKELMTYVNQTFPDLNKKINMSINEKEDIKRALLDGKYNVLNAYMNSSSLSPVRKAAEVRLVEIDKEINKLESDIRDSKADLEDISKIERNVTTQAESSGAFKTDTQKAIDEANSLIKNYGEKYGKEV